MLSKYETYTPSGNNLIPVGVEVHVFERGFPKTSIIGLPNALVKESIVRIKSAIINSGLKFPIKKIVINLTPVSMTKSYNVFDLQLALGVMSSVYRLKPTHKCLFSGQLSLTGMVVPSVLDPTLYRVSQKYDKIYVSSETYSKIGAILPSNAVPVSNLNMLLNTLRSSKPIPINHKSPKIKYKKRTKETLSNVSSMEYAKRALEISIAGGHSLVIFGSPGIGKTLLCQSIPKLLPKLNIPELQTVISSHSIENNGVLYEVEEYKRPYIKIDRETTKKDLLGNPVLRRIGLIQAASQGVLYADDFLMYDKRILEYLSKCLTNKPVVKRSSVTNNELTANTPNILFIASANPCTCGYFKNKSKLCTCTPYQVRQYQNKLTEPFRDRIAMFVFINTMPGFSFSSCPTNRDYAYSIEKCRHIQYQRNNEHKTNSNLSFAELRGIVESNTIVTTMLSNNEQLHNISTRREHSIIKVAKTIADLESSPVIKEHHLLESIEYSKFPF